MVTFSGGAKRSKDEGKGMPGLMQVHGLIRISKLCEKGKNQYGARNMEKGMPISRILESMWRHVLKYTGGATDEDHLAAIAWNAMTIMQMEELIKRGLMDAKFDDHRVLLDENGKQCIARCIFLPDEFLPKEINTKKSRKSKKKKKKK